MSKHRPVEFIWVQNVTLFGNKIPLHTTNLRKSWGIKSYETFRYWKVFKTQFTNTKQSSLLKLFITFELGAWIYSKICKTYIMDHNASTKDIDQIISTSTVYKLFQKENHVDYLSNIVIYNYLGKLLYIKNKKLFYTVFLLGGISSYLFLKLNDKVRVYFEDKLNIEDFSLYSTSPNLIPRILVTTNMLLFGNYFLKENFFHAFELIPINYKVFYMFFWSVFITKFSRFLSYLSNENVK
jgi:hypothetical protein